jgi:hypothetical protein
MARQRYKPPTDEELKEWYPVPPSKLETVLNWWKEEAPEMYKALKENGTLEEEAKMTVRRFYHQIGVCQEQGMTYAEALELAWQDLMALPPQDEEENEEEPDEQ